MGSFEDHRNRCELCDAIARRLLIRGDQLDAYENGGAECPYYQLHRKIEQRILHVDPSIGRVGRFWLEWCPHPQHPEFYALNIPHDMESEWWDIYTEPGSTKIPGIQEWAEPGPSNTGQPSWAFIERCREVCRGTHDECQKRRLDIYLPPRLLRVQDDGLVLLESVDIPPESRYVALSYCWGPAYPPSLCSTKATIAEFKTLVPKAIIPAVIRDAMEFARKVGQQYIWIDRLCIQQDDPEDWHLHGGIMDRIYEHAEITVCAVTSSNVDQHFLDEGGSNDRQKCASSLIEWQNPAWEKENTFRVRLRSKYLHIQYSNDERSASQITAGENVPLDRRGWTFQERFLSSRCVRYEPQQIKWECRSAQFMEFFPLDTLIPPRWSITQSRPMTAMLWSEAVRAFTERHLSFATDRITAMSGFASRYEQTIKQKYLAGLWQGKVMKGLSWEVANNEIELENSGHVFSEGRGVPGVPSWSWTSVSQYVMYNSYGVEGFSDDRYSKARIVRADVSPATVNPFGPVKQPALLSLEAVTVDGQLICQEQPLVSKPSPKYKVKFFSANNQLISLGLVCVDCHLHRITDPVRNRHRGNGHLWRRNMIGDKNQNVGGGSAAPIKILQIEPDSRDGEGYTRDYSFALILSPGNTDANGKTTWLRVGTMGIPDDRKDFQKVMHAIKPTIISLE